MASVRRGRAQAWSDSETATRYFGLFLAAVVSTILSGFAATKLRGVKWPLCFGFLICMGAHIGFSCIQPSTNALPIAMAVLFGLGVRSSDRLPGCR